MPLKIVRVEPGSAAGRGVGIRWSSIFAGAFLTVGFGIFFLLLGNAVGLQMSNTFTPGVGSTLAVWSWVYMAVTLIASYCLGSFLCTRGGHIDTPESGALHGLVAWGLASALVLTALVIAIPGFRFVLSGQVSNSVNWLAICIVGLGMFGSLISGAVGKRFTLHREEEGRISEPALGEERRVV